MRPLVVVLAGPTAVGKSDVAAQLCAAHQGTIVSADSVQAYRGVQIGANKPTKEELAKTPYRLIDVAGPNDNYNAAEWRTDAIAAIDELTNESKLPVVVGGTMMYLQWLVHGRPDAMQPTEEALTQAKAIIEGFEGKDDWEAAERHVRDQGERYSQQVDKLSGKDWYRIRRILEIALSKPSDEANVFSGEREGSLESLGYDVRCFFLCPNDRMQHTTIVDERCEQMIQRGLFQETTDLSLAGELPDMAARAIGYRQVLDYLNRNDPRNEDATAFQSFLDEFTTATRRYAKRQMQWFRKDDSFVFVPVSVTEDKTRRVEATTKHIARLMKLERDVYDAERADENSVWRTTRRTNEEQGKLMKTYQFQRHILKPGSSEETVVLSIADECTHRLQAKRRKPA